MPFHPLDQMVDLVQTVLDKFNIVDHTQAGIDPSGNDATAHPSSNGYSNLTTWMPSEEDNRDTIKEFLHVEPEWVDIAISRDPALYSKPLNPALTAFKQQRLEYGLKLYDDIKSKIQTGQAITEEQRSTLLDAIAEDTNLREPPEKGQSGKEPEYTKAAKAAAEAIKNYPEYESYFIGQAVGLLGNFEEGQEQAASIRAKVSDHHALTSEQKDLLRDVVESSFRDGSKDTRGFHKQDFLRAISNYPKVNIDKMDQPLASLKRHLTYDPKVEEIGALVAAKKSLSEQNQELLIEAIDKSKSLLPGNKEKIKASIKQYPTITDEMKQDIISELLTYQGLHAIAWHHRAHRLYEQGETTRARIISQGVRRQTAGIEIHPGATIGKNFFIDHGSGVVVGETCEIGDNCMLYHHVTLGNDGSRISEGMRRHPKLGDNVTIYTGAEILGPVDIEDDVVVGADTQIIGNVHIGRGAKIGPGLVIRQDVGAGQVVTKAQDGKPSFSKEADSMQQLYVTEPFWQTRMADEKQARKNRNAVVAGAK